MAIPFSVTKVAVIRTCRGHTLVLNVDGLRVLAFPDEIDPSDLSSMANIHSTLEWPLGESLRNLCYFAPGPGLFGWDIIRATRGAFSINPWINLSNMNSCPGVKSTSHVVVTLQVDQVSNHKPNQSLSTHQAPVPIGEYVNRIFQHCIYETFGDQSLVTLDDID